jgi:hypothetical protein
MSFDIVVSINMSTDNIVAAGTLTGQRQINNKIEFIAIFSIFI